MTQPATFFMGEVGEPVPNLNFLWLLVTGAGRLTVSLNYCVSMSECFYLTWRHGTNRQTDRRTDSLTFNALPWRRHNINTILVAFPVLKRVMNVSMQSSNFSLLIITVIMQYGLHCVRLSVYLSVPRLSLIRTRSSSKPRFVARRSTVKVTIINMVLGKMCYSHNIRTDGNECSPRTAISDQHTSMKSEVKVKKTGRDCFLF